MLSKHTTRLLDGASAKSDEIYSEGGLIYLYTFGYKRAHSFIDYEILKKTTISKKFDRDEIEKLKNFFTCALEHPYPEKVYNSINIFTDEFLTMLYKDFQGMYSYMSKYEKDEVGQIVTMTFIKDNNFHSLELFWSID